ncbi:MAG: hypothetical protein LC107_00755 [Chitinophagales bacterium]|nr:hypothetical protein [Chitinophagales bacterium]
MERLFLALFLFSFFACKPDIHSHQENIERLGSDWVKIEDVLTNFSNEITKNLNNYTESSNTYMLDDSIELSLNDENIIKWENAKKEYYKNTIEAYAPLQKEVSVFIDFWSERASDIGELKESMERGNLDKNSTKKIDELNALVGETKEKITKWYEMNIELNSKAELSTENLRNIYETLTQK